jgi:hypothetical protein
MWGIALVFGVLLSLCIVVGMALIESPWPASTTAKHWFSYPNCAAARAMGMAPASAGQPGYYLRHDRDGDGISCEPWPHK